MILQGVLVIQHSSVRGAKGTKGGHGHLPHLPQACNIQSDLRMQARGAGHAFLTAASKLGSAGCPWCCTVPLASTTKACGMPET